MRWDAMHVSSIERTVLKRLTDPPVQVLQLQLADLTPLNEAVQRPHNLVHLVSQLLVVCQHHGLRSSGWEVGSSIMPFLKVCETPCVC
jgi:hypothetical protein